MSHIIKQPGEPPTRITQLKPLGWIAVGLSLGYLCFSDFVPTVIRYVSNHGSEVLSWTAIIGALVLVADFIRKCLKKDRD